MLKNRDRSIISSADPCDDLTGFYIIDPVHSTDQPLDRGAIEGIIHHQIAILEEGLAFVGCQRKLHASWIHVGS